MVGGSADLTGSNLTKTSTMRSITPGNFRGNYVHFGIREHAMGAVMNGMALHGGMIPYGGTFLVFSDYMRGSMRLSALMKQRVIYVLTHDSIGLGEDGPTHQPIEHLAMLRATPNMLVFRRVTRWRQLKHGKLLLNRLRRLQSWHCHDRDYPQSAQNGQTKISHRKAVISSRMCAELEISL